MRKRSFRHLEVTNSSLRLSWVAGLTGGLPIESYQVLSEGLESATSPTTSVLLTALEGDTTYRLQVRATSALGVGQVSAVLLVRTGPLLPRQVMGLEALVEQSGSELELVCDLDRPVHELQYTIIIVLRRSYIWPIYDLYGPI